MKSRFILDADDDRFDRVKISAVQNPGGDAKELFVAKTTISRRQRGQGHTMNAVDPHAATETAYHDRLDHVGCGLIPSVGRNCVKHHTIRHAGRNMLENFATFGKSSPGGMEVMMKIGLKLLSIAAHQTGPDPARTIQRHIGRVNQRVRWFRNDVTMLDGSNRLHRSRNKLSILVFATRRFVIQLPSALRPLPFAFS